MLQKLSSIKKTSWGKHTRKLLCTLVLTGLITIPFPFIYDLQWICPVSALMIMEDESMNADTLIIDENMNYTVANIERFQEYRIEEDIRMKENATLFLSNINGSISITGDIIIEKNATISLSGIYGTISVRADIIVEKDASLLLMGKKVRMTPPFGFQISGNILLEENSTFTLHSIPIVFNQRKNYEYTIIANNSKVHLMDTVIVSLRMFNLTFYQYSRVTINALKKVTGFRTPALKFMDDSHGEISDIELEYRSGFIEAYNSSSITLINVKPESGIKLYQSATIHVNVSGSVTSPIPVIQAFDTSNLHVHGAIAKSLEAHNSSEVTIVDSKIDIVKAFDNSKISMHETKITNVLQAYASSNIAMNNSNSEWISYFFGNSTAKILGSEFSILSVSEYAKINTHEAKIALLELSENAVLNVSNSEISSVLIEYNSVSGAIQNLRPKFYEHWNLKLESQNITQKDGYAPEILFENTQIHKGISFRFNGQSDVTINNSEIENLHVTGSSSVQLLGNSTIDSYTIQETAKIHTTSIHINIIDIHGKSLSGTDVTLLLNDTVIEHGITNTDGSVSFTNNYLVDKYIVIAKWNNYSTQESVELLGKPITITLSLPAPWWQTYWYVILITAAVVALFLVVVVWKKTKARFQRPLPKSTP